jgi:hypothetical protein
MNWLTTNEVENERLCEGADDAPFLYICVVYFVIEVSKS